MSVTALCLVVTAALLHSLWNLAVKHAGADNRFALLVSLIIIVLWAPPMLWAAWGVVPHWGWREWALMLASGLLHLVYFNTLMRGYRVADLTVVYPVARGSGPLLSSIVAVTVLGEKLSSLGAIGVLGVCGGVFLIAGGPRVWHALRGSQGGGDAEQRRRIRLGLSYGAATGVCIAGYTVVDSYSAKVMLISPILIDYFGNLLRTPLMVPHAMRDWAGTLASWRRLWKHALIVAAFSPLGYILVLFAVRTAPISHVAPAREVSMLFAALIGGKLLGEGDVALRITGAVCIALGVMALALG
jgi:drug/metabolite transporter (DMT)-like permease